MKLIFFVVLFMILIFSATAIAEEPLCTEGDRRMCGSDVGICEPGRSICKGGEWVECIGSVGPISEFEVCGNGVDDNCNGEVDEGCFPWLSLILIGIGIFFIGIGIYYMQKGKGERIITEGLGKD